MKMIFDLFCIDPALCPAMAYGLVGVAPPLRPPRRPSR